MRLYRATKYKNEPAEDGICEGMCFAKNLEDALEYTDNPGFGGKYLYMWEVEVNRVLTIYRQSDLETALDTEIDRADYEYLHQVWEENPDYMETLAENYDWVTYEDEYPLGCQTWCALKDMGAPVSWEKIK